MVPKVGDYVKICYSYCDGNNNSVGKIVEIAIGGFRNATYAKIITEKGMLSYYIDDLKVIQLIGPSHGDKSR